jgi:hypothetical protein
METEGEDRKGSETIERAGRERREVDRQLSYDGGL